MSFESLMAKQLFLNLGQWVLHITYDCPQIAEILLENISSALISHESKATPDQILLHIHIDRVQPGASTTTGGSKYEALIHEFGLQLESNIELNKVHIRIQRESVSNSVVYHVGVLQSLSLLLNQFESSLIHAALLSRNNQGILIPGTGGAGKSSIALSLLERGFVYFSDENPILSIANQAIQGSSFFTHLGIRPQMATHFSAHTSKWKWQHSREKFCIDPVLQYKEQLGMSCDIKFLVFPNCTYTKLVDFKKITPGDAFDRLIRDDYFGLNLFYRGQERTKAVTLNIMKKLVESTEIYFLNYGEGMLGLAVDRLCTEIF